MKYTHVPTRLLFILLTFAVFFSHTSAQEELNTSLDYQTFETLSSMTPSSSSSEFSFNFYNQSLEDMGMLDKTVIPAQQCLEVPPIDNVAFVDKIMENEQWCFAENGILEPREPVVAPHIYECGCGYRNKHVFKDIKDAEHCRVVEFAYKTQMEEALSETNKPHGNIEVDCIYAKNNKTCSCALRVQNQRVNAVGSCLNGGSKAFNEIYDVDEEVSCSQYRRTCACNYEATVIVVEDSKKLVEYEDQYECPDAAKKLKNDINKHLRALQSNENGDYVGNIACFAIEDDQPGGGAKDREKVWCSCRLRISKHNALTTDKCDALNNAVVGNANMKSDTAAVLESDLKDITTNVIVQKETFFVVEDGGLLPLSCTEYTPPIKPKWCACSYSKTMFYPQDFKEKTPEQEMKQCEDLRETLHRGRELALWKNNLNSSVKTVCAPYVEDGVDGCICASDIVNEAIEIPPNSICKERKDAFCYPFDKEHDTRERMRLNIVIPNVPTEEEVLNDLWDFFLNENIEKN